MEEILEQILASVQKLEQGQRETQQEIGRVNKRLDSIEQEISDLRDSTFAGLERVNKEMGAMRDMQTIALEKWNKSNTIMERVENLLDERKEEVIAIEATLVDYGRRINKLEQVTV